MTADGLHVSGYRVEVLLGVGSSGDVWRARVRESGAEVALKRIRSVGAASFEVAALARVDHPNLIRIHDVVPIDDGVVLVLDFAGGGSLARLLVARGRLHPGEVVGALTPIASALASVHSAGIVHGDVSPSNILFSAEGLPLLADLGLAHLNGARAPGLTAVPYADPFTLPGESTGFESDVYSLGAVAFHALIGETLTRAADALEHLRCAGIPPEITEVVCSALQADARCRPTAAAFALELQHSGAAIRVELRAGRHAAAGAGAVLTRGARLPKPVLPTSAPKRSRIGLRLRPLVGLAVSLVLIALAVIVWSGGSSPLSTGVAVRSPSRPPTVAPTAKPTSAAHRTPTLQQALKALDSRRESAYEKRDPGLLAEVYSSALLRQRDSLQLLRLIPAGCGLRGVRSTYGAPTVVRENSASVTLRVRVQLLPSTLICQGRLTATAPGLPATTMTITLSRVGSSYRIADQRRMT